MDYNSSRYVSWVIKTNSGNNDQLNVQNARFHRNYTGGSLKRVYNIQGRHFGVF